MPETDPETPPPAAKEQGAPEGHEPNEAEQLRADLERWKAQARKHEERAKENFEWRKANEDKVKQYAALEEASRSESERAIEAARREARDTTRAEVEAESRVKYGSALIGAEFRVHLAGRLAPEQITTLVDGLDVSRFMTEDGRPDTERIAGYVAAIPATTAAAPAPGPRVSAGQGNRAPVKASGLDEGASLFAERHKPRAASNT